MLDESNSKCLSTFQPGRSLFRTSLLLLNNKYRSLSSERHLSKSSLRITPLPLSFSAAFLMFVCIVFTMHYLFIRLSRFFITVRSRVPQELGSCCSSSFLSKQPSVIRRPRFFSSGFWSKSLLGRYKKENLYKKVWHPPILPYRLQHSTVGRTGLNRRVRDGNGCGPCAHRHQTNLTFSSSNI